MKFIISILIIALPALSYAAPADLTVSGTVSDGQSITIGGTGFTTKSPAKPQVWAPFDSDLNPSNLGVITSWSDNSQFSWDSNEDPQAQGVAKGDTCNGDWSTASWTLYIDTTAQGWYYNTYSQKSYVYRKSKRNFTIGTSNTKNMRADTSSESSLCDVMQLGSANAWGPEGCDVWINDANNSIYMQSTPTTFNNSTDWNTEELFVQANSSTSTIDGYYRWDVNGINLFTCDSRVSPCDSSGPRGVYLRGDSGSCAADINLIPGAFVTRHENYPNGGIVWADDIYMDNTWARVMICSGSTWAARGTCEIQIPSAWSTTSATITVHQGSLSGANYLYVVDNANAANSSGYEVTFGAGGDTTAPTTTISDSDPKAVTTSSTTLTGTSSDAVGVSGCKWRLGSAPDANNGTACTGTTSWSCSVTGLQSGANTAYVGCYDAAGNYGSDSIAVNYTPPTLSITGVTFFSGGSIQ